MTAAEFNSLRVGDIAHPRGGDCALMVRAINRTTKRVVMFVDDKSRSYRNVVVGSDGTRCAAGPYNVAFDMVEELQVRTTSKQRANLWQDH